MRPRLRRGAARPLPGVARLTWAAHRYDEYGRLKKNYRDGGEDRRAREAAALARLQGASPKTPTCIAAGASRPCTARVRG